MLYIWGTKKYEEWVFDMKKRFRKDILSYWVTLILTLVLLIAIVVYTFGSFYKIIRDDVIIMGEKTTQELSEQVQNFLMRGYETLEVTADSVEYMVSDGMSSEEIESFLITESNKCAERISEDFTGIYGWINDAYVDGLGWVPEADYVPQKRIWYTMAMENKENGVTLIPPYVDAQTGNIIVSISKVLDDGESVLALDITPYSIQDATEALNLNGNGYGFIIDNNGLIVTHADSSLRGTSYLEKTYLVAEQQELVQRIMTTEDSYFSMTIDEEECQVFRSKVRGGWNVVLVVKSQEMFQRVRTNLFRNITLSMVIFVLVTYFCTSSYFNRVKAARYAEEVKKAKDEAEKANEAKSDFLANMSHEIRTPINAVMGMNAMILRESDDANVREYAGKAHNASKTLLALINDILDLSKIEAGKMEIVKDVYYLSSVLNNVVNMMRVKAEEKKLEFKVEIDEEIPDELMGDETRISQVIINILNNAVKYTREGSVCLKIEKLAGMPGCGDGDIPEDLDGECVEQDEIVLKISVSDTGIGIREEDMGKLFGNFERLDQKANKNVEGTGLGLSITGKMVEMMNGRIEVESVYGEGSTFTIYIPQAVEGDVKIGNFEEKFAQYVKSLNAYKETFRAPGAHILVVDDNEMNLFVVEKLLKTTEVTVSCCDSGERCLELIRQRHFDVILLDHMMPELDGVETLKRMKQMKNHLCKDTPVIALTANAIVGVREMYLADGFDDYLSKPIDANELEAMLRKHLPKDKVVVEILEPQVSVEEFFGPVISDDELFAVEAEPEGEAMHTGTYIDRDTAMLYCAGSEEIFREFLGMFCNLHEQKKALIEKCYAEEDWNGYGIELHSLKSTSLSIGGKKISELAFELEKAGKSGDGEYIRLHHEEAMTLYEATVQEGLRILGQSKQ